MEIRIKTESIFKLFFAFLSEILPKISFISRIKMNSLYDNKIDTKIQPVERLLYRKTPYELLADHKK